jgi:hypothetical protein
VSGFPSCVLSFGASGFRDLTSFYSLLRPSQLPKTPGRLSRYPLLTPGCRRIHVVFGAVVTTGAGTGTEIAMGFGSARVIIPGKPAIITKTGASFMKTRYSKDLNSNSMPTIMSVVSTLSWMKRPRRQAVADTNITPLVNFPSNWNDRISSNWDVFRIHRPSILGVRVRHHPPSLHIIELGSLTCYHDPEMRTVRAYLVGRLYTNWDLQGGGRMLGSTTSSAYSNAGTRMTIDEVE